MENGINGSLSQSDNTSILESEAALVFFDLETGGLGTGVDILQIAAACNNQTFVQYVTPTRDVAPEAEAVNNLTNRGGVLMKIISKDPLKLEELQTMRIKQALQKFMAWLDVIGPCFLVGHNVAFDKKHLLFHVEREGLLSGIKERVLGFIDTLPVYRRLYPELKKPGPGHRQCVLVNHLLKEDYEAHDALEDVKALKRLVDNTKVTREDLMRYARRI